MLDHAAILRWATVGDAEAVARLLHDFNTEFDTPSPGPDVLARRLHHLLGRASTLALLAGDVPFGVALVTLRSNVWFDGPVALLDELYVEPSWRSHGVGSAMMAAIAAEVGRRGVELVEVNVDEVDHDARRFYERHGFSSVDPDAGCPALYYTLEL